jgi:hypothetical protein
MISEEVAEHVRARELNDTSFDVAVPGRQRQHQRRAIVRRAAEQSLFCDGARRFGGVDARGNGVDDVAGVQRVVYAVGRQDETLVGCRIQLHKQALQIHV